MTSGKRTDQFSATLVSGAATSGVHTGPSLAAVVAARWPCASSVAGEGRRVCIIGATARRGSRVLIEGRELEAAGTAGHRRALAGMLDCPETG